MNTNSPIQLAKATVVLELGLLCITPAARDALSRRGLVAGVYMTRHAMGDFGDLDAEDQAANKAALSNGRRVFSSYNLPERGDDSVSKVWVITEADRSVTTVLLPTEY